MSEHPLTEIGPKGPRTSKCKAAEVKKKEPHGSPPGTPVDRTTRGKLQRTDKELRRKESYTAPPPGRL